MTIRSELHVSKVGDFTLYLMCNGWEYQAPVGEWEVLRMKKKGVKDPLLVYRRKDLGEHLTIYGQSEAWYRKWRRALKPHQFKGAPRGERQEIHTN